MKQKSLISLLALSTLFIIGCTGQGDSSSSSSSSSQVFCQDDSADFVFGEDATLATTIEGLDDGFQNTADRNAILDLLGTNDGYANAVGYTLEDVVDYDVMDTLDDPRDFTGTYIKNVTRYDAVMLLEGGYSLYENYYDEEASLEVTNSLAADYQVFRNGFCPAISRFYEIYDFPGTEDDVAIENVYGTETYIRELYLVNGQALALDLVNEYVEYGDSHIFTTLTFTAEKFDSNADGEVEANPDLNTSTSLELLVTGTYAPSGLALGETVSHSVIVVDGMVKTVRSFQGTYEIDGDDTIYHDYTEQIATYSVEDVGAFAGALLDPDDFTFTTAHPNL
ncbi:MAG: hypothetical protein WC344_00990 [Bacilli bacterium]|jgi:hypothetical protein